MSSESFEVESLAFLHEMQVRLAHALNSIAGKTTEPGISYLVWGAAHVNKIVAGYGELRKRGMIHASKIMVRPVLETTAAVNAMINQPGFYFHKAYTEYREEKALLKELNAVLEKAGEPTDLMQKQMEILESEWDDFKRSHDKLPDAGANPTTKLTFPDVLKAADMNSWYVQYRLYCGFTHGALHALTGDLDAMTDPTDNVMMGSLTLMMLALLAKRAPVQVPNLKPFSERLTTLSRQARNNGDGL